MPSSERSQSCSEAWGSLGALESSGCRAVTGGGEAGIKAACPGKVTWAAGGEVGSSGAGEALGWRDEGNGRNARDVGGHELCDGLMGICCAKETARGSTGCSAIVVSVCV